MTSCVHWIPVDHPPCIAIDLRYNLLSILCYWANMIIFIPINISSTEIIIRKTSSMSASSMERREALSWDMDDLKHVPCHLTPWPGPPQLTWLRRRCWTERLHLPSLDCPSCSGVWPGTSCRGRPLTARSQTDWVLLSDPVIEKFLNISNCPTFQNTTGATVLTALFPTRLSSLSCFFESISMNMCHQDTRN